ncbi:MAG: phosphoribosyltransferase, partial [Candidatus Binatia bacterium]
MFRFKNREEAAKKLAAALQEYRGKTPLVLAIPRGAVPMARMIADALGGEVDVILVHKLGAPGQPELAIGSIDESGHTYWHPYARELGIPKAYLDQEARAQLALLRERRQRYSRGREPIPIRDRIVMVVDDGIATGSTMIAALQAARRREPKKLIVVTAVAPPDTLKRLEKFADEVVCLQTPESFYAVGQFFEEFPQVSDEEVLAILTQGESPGGPNSPVHIPAGEKNLAGDLVIPAGAKGLVLFAHGSGSSHQS